MNIVIDYLPILCLTIGFLGVFIEYYFSDKNVYYDDIQSLYLLRNLKQMSNDIKKINKETEQIIQKYQEILIQEETKCEQSEKLNNPTTVQ